MHILDELWVQTYINLADFPLFGKRKLSNRKSSPVPAAQHFQTLENLPCRRRNVSRRWKTSRAGGATFPDAGKPPALAAQHFQFPDAGKPPALAAQHFQTLENLPRWRRNVSRRWKKEVCRNDIYFETVSNTISNSNFSSS